MAESRAAYRYALALIGIAEETKQLDPVSADMTMLARAINESRELQRFLQSPIVNKAKKRAVLDELLKGKVSDLTYRFVELITAKDREAMLPEIIREFIRLRDEHLGILRATVKSAAPLTKKQQDELAQKLGEVTGKRVMLKETLDPSLIGGFTVQYADTVLDGSVRHQLNLLRERFEAGTA